MFRTSRLLNSFTKNVNKYNTRNILDFKWIYNHDMIDDTLSCRLPEPTFMGIGYEIQLYKVKRTFKLGLFELWTTGYSVRIPDGFYGVILPNNRDIESYGFYTTIKSNIEEELVVFVDNDLDNIYKKYMLLVLPIKN